MGTAAAPCQVKLIAGIIASSEELFNETGKAMEDNFGPIDYASRIIRFDFTKYYERDMGPDLKRRFVSFQKLIDPAGLPDIKLATNKLEEVIARRAKTKVRPVNIDPGYIAASKLILASTKDYFHRIYINKGIYAEVTLYYRNGTFTSMDWTYPDYKTKDYIKIFDEIRDIFMNQIQQKGLSPYHIT